MIGVQPLLAGLLLAVAAGLLALALVRVIAFAAGGIAAVYGVRLLPPAPWQEPLICFLGGGLLGLLLFVMGGGAVSIDRLFRRKKEPAEEDDAYDHTTAGAAT